MFTETRPLAQEWVYRFLGAALVHHRDDRDATPLVTDLREAGPVPAPPPTTAEVRAWARQQGVPVAAGGRLQPDVWAAYRDSVRRADTADGADGPDADTR